MHHSSAAQCIEVKPEWLLEVLDSPPVDGAESGDFINKCGFDMNQQT
jgi:hypothetical protein